MGVTMLAEGSSAGSASGGEEDGGHSSPAERLAGMMLDGKWKVIQAIEQPRLGGTGGNFSIGYVVRHKDGHQGFLKAFDLSSALMSARTDADWAQELTDQLEMYNFERALLDECAKLDRVVRAIDAGSIPIGTIPGQMFPIFYLVFELAERDMRAQANLTVRCNVPLCFGVLHNVANGLQQLHEIMIAHQDMKPSNVLIFRDEQAGEVGRKLAKVGDLGRAAHQLRPAPRKYRDAAIPGDRDYAPPELLYQHVDADWGRRRFGADLYLLGSLVVYCFTGVSMTTLLCEQLAPMHRWRTPRDDPKTGIFWRGDYASVLPHVIDAYARAVELFRTELNADLLRQDETRPRRAAAVDDLVEAVRQLCHPDPAKRGHPDNRSSNQYGLERYVSLFARLSKAADGGFI